MDGMLVVCFRLFAIFIKMTVETHCAEADKDNETSKMHASDAVNFYVGLHSVPTHVVMATEPQCYASVSDDQA